jgi:hypothetical protein
MTSLKQAVTLLAALAAALVVTASAGAIDGDPDPEPPPTLAKPNLVISAGSVVPYGASQWAINYTVANRGTADAKTFHTAVQQNGTTLLKDTLRYSLAAGASRSETIYVNRNDCYIAVRFFADSTGLVSESKETDNQRWVTGLTSPTCPTQPRYKVKAVSFHAVDESGIDWTGSDEPFGVFSGAGPTGQTVTTKSHVFGDIDTGDTGYFGAAEGCMYISCVGGAAPFGMGFSIQLWEHDLGEIPQILTETALAFQKAGGLIDEYTAQTWLAKALTCVGDGLNWVLAQIWADDLIGSNTYTYTPAYLASRLPAAGGSFDDTRYYTDGDAVYTLTVQVTRTF